MTIATFFLTPTLIELDAFTVFGANAKPNTNNPIGFFGTGLKYAVAVLVREKIKVSLFIGRQEYEFYTRAKNFRGTEIWPIMMRKRTHGLAGVLSPWRYTQLPYTTQLGRNWKLWQVFRELYTNTVDEQGSVFTHENVDFPLDDQTCIVVHGDVFAQEYMNRGNTFLEGHTGPAWDGNVSVEVIKEPTKHVYWRGMRVWDLPEEQRALYTYNIVAPMELTEDRTIKYAFYVHAAIVNHIAASEDEQLIQSVIRAPDKTLESVLDWSMASCTPSATFRRVMQLTKAQRYTLRSGLSSYYSRYDEPAPVLAGDWRTELIQYIRDGEEDLAKTCFWKNSDALLDILTKDITTNDGVPF